jgi:hypothetical protein
MTCPSAAASEPLQPLPMEEPERRRPIHHRAHREAGHLERLEVAGVGEAVVRGKDAHREDIVRGGAVEHEHRDAEPPRDAGRPRAARVGEETVRQPRQGPQVRRAATWRRRTWRSATGRPSCPCSRSPPAGRLRAQGRRARLRRRRGPPARRGPGRPCSARRYAASARR